MSVAKLIEISTELPRYPSRIHAIRSVWVQEQHVAAENGKVALYRVDLKTTFTLG
ncbi:MAG: dodecin domain-containing protein [Nitrospira sp.]|nr:dodecin domain-containing protein [Nitrospira sp.]